MSSRLRSLNSSKISFFAFQDIITAVSGILILVTLWLATDLENPAQTEARDPDPALEQKLQETLRQQMDADAENRRLQELLADAETAPALEKLESDISQLRAQLSVERKKQTTLGNQMASNNDAIEARDKTLGLTDLKAAIQRMIQEVEILARKETNVRTDMENLEQQVTRAQSRLLKLRQREGQLWLIPDKSATTKEPILVTVSGSGATIERFNNANQRKQLEKTRAESEFESYLRKTKALDQYVVFLVRPSGIKLFQDLVEIARAQGFEVGFDALEEDRQIHFSTPPVMDESVPQTNSPMTSANQPTRNASTTASNGAAPSTNAAPIVATQKPSQSQPQKPNAAPPAKNKNWWQKLLEFVGLR